MFKRTILFVCILSLFIGLNCELIIATANPLTASSNVGLDKLKNATDFKLFTPNSFENYKLEIKEPYPLVLSRRISKLRLHYFDKSGQTYLFGIEEHKADGYKINRVETHFDVRNQTSTTRTIVEDFKFDVSGAKVNINGFEARFVAWANHIPGGYLRWVQDGTYIEIDSGALSKEMMVELAKSMK
ncbi:DUF4367 domain-containing protein [Bacillus sp. FJAT-28004]|uniref:DUF4367 domain-containing protein n=1 Tax=Bacillus sp. FJAT-28004 TaxID=1679165 RepID=UPI0006B54F31|nr:DUF4367 domain-containing protein [Bacillus sp. FJAT-28004]